MRVEVRTGAATTPVADDKARILEETLSPGAKVTEVARRNGVAVSLVFTWRRQARTPEQVEADRCRSRDLDAPAANLALIRQRYRKGNQLPAQPLAVGRKNWTFAGSDTGGRRAAAVYTLIETCNVNDVDPQAWLADVLARLPDHPANSVADLLPWNWKLTQQSKAVAA